MSVGFVNGVLQNVQGIVPLGDRAQDIGTSAKAFDNLYIDGISFNDGANFLSSFVTGTFTPTLTFGGNAVGMTFSKQYGRFTRIGDLVFINLTLALTAKGSSTGIAVVNLNTAPALNATESTPFYVLYSNITFSSANFTWGNALGQTNNTNITLAEDGSGQIANALTANAFANDSVVQLAGCYHTDAS